MPDRAWPRTVDESRLSRYAEANTEGPGIWKWAHYYPIYERHLAKFVGTDATVVEVGIFSGGSLGMWRDFFGPAATIHGIDIAAECRAYENETIQVAIGDQGDPKFWEEFLARVPRIDVLIDDGGHQPHQQIATIEAILPHLTRGGVYICEDVAGLRNPFLSYIDGLAVNLGAWHAPDPLSTRTVPTVFQAAVNSIHRYPYLAVLEMNDVPVTEFHAPRYGTDWQPF